MEKYKIINLTDLAFQKYCQSKYGLNKGIYNTIEAWFYKRGYSDIQRRRSEVLEFINFILPDTHSKKVKFGSGGLVQKLNEYVTKSESVMKIIS
ncbi:hypothetical protein [Peribacillus simplex]|uniref:hypothetical protein n=1 Tax=Peribacillus simplex TaxID=1478 RepID=UPI00366AF857